MYNPINRLTVQTGDNRYKVYPKQSPIFYKNQEGKMSEIDLTFKDSTSSIGDISLMDSGIMSVGVRKDKNTHKITGIRPDNCQTGEKQLEFSVINIELDDNEEPFDDMEIKLGTTSIFQLIKLNKKFGKCKIEFDIHSKGLELENEKYKEDLKLSDYEFKLTNIGDIKGEDSLSMYQGYSSESKDMPYFDCYVGKISDNYITTGGYENSEEFGVGLSDYTVKKMYMNGGSMYLKDCIIFAVKPYNISNFKEILVNQLCDIYGLEQFNDGGTGEYFTKDNKKIGGYFSNDNTFFSFFNTTEIPDSIKTLFKTKTFEDTSFLDIELNSFCENIKNRLDKDLTILVDSNYYEPINNSFKFKVNNNYFCINKPIAFDKDLNELGYKTTHTLKKNENGTFRYTKHILPETALNINDARYLDATVSTSEDGTSGNVWFHQASSTSGSEMDTETTFDLYRNNTACPSISAGEVAYALSSTDVKYAAGERSYSTFTPAGKDTPASTRKTYIMYQNHLHFDTSGITDNVLTAKMNIFGYCPTGGFDGIFIKSYYNGTPQTATVGLFTYKYDWNNFFTPGGTTATPSGWSSSDVTTYSSEETLITGALGNINTMSNQNEISLNASAKTDLENDDDFALCLLEHDEYYSNNYTATAGIGTANADAYAYHLPNSSQTARRPYIEFTTGTAPAPPTSNATFFGTNF